MNFTNWYNADVQDKDKLTDYLANMEGRVLLATLDDSVQGVAQFSCKDWCNGSSDDEGRKDDVWREHYVVYQAIIKELASRLEVKEKGV